MKWRSKLKDMLAKGASKEEMYFLLHCIVNGNNFTFYDAIVNSEEWLLWNDYACDKGFDWSESTETGWLSPKHLKAFYKFIKTQ